MPLNVTSSKDVEGKPGIVDYNRSDEEDLETALEVIHIDSTKVGGHLETILTRRINSVLIYRTSTPSYLF